MSVLRTAPNPGRGRAQPALDTPSRRERNKREKRERIVRAARSPAARKGFESATTREIAQATDMGAGTRFLSAGTKEDLLVSIARAEIERVAQASLELQLAGLTRGSPQTGAYGRSKARVSSIAGARAKSKLRGVR